jgi:excisionase family DNA binding protein
MTEYFTTRELAEFLRIKERKVYDLAASGKVPCSKAMGKLLFPRDAIEAWVAGEQTGPTVMKTAAPLPNVFLGSHDPLLEWALRESQSGLATYFDGSVDGLRRFGANEGVATGLHLYDANADDWNTTAALGVCANKPIVLVEWARRWRGLIASRELSSKLKGMSSLKGLRVAARQEDAGAQVLFRELLRQASLSPDDIETTVLARSETDAALAVLDGKADVSFGLQSLAAQYRLGFVAVIEERFDLAVDRRAWFEPPFQDFVSFCRGSAFAERAAEFAGYDVSRLFYVHYNSPS